MAGGAWGWSGAVVAVDGCLIREECEVGEEQTGRKQQGAPE